MFRDTVTVFHHSIKGDKDIYTRTVVSGVYWYGSAGIAASGKGLEVDNIVTIISSPEKAREYDDTWSVESGDKIVRGVCGDISSFKELNGKDVITVKSCSVNVVGSDDTDNVTITGK